MRQEKAINISVEKIFLRRVVATTVLSVFVWVVSAVTISAQQPAQQQVHTQQDTAFPDGPGKDALLKTCSRCHSPNLVIANAQDRDGWENTITKMVSLGAVGTDEDFTAILDYLVKNFPQPTKINVNKATPSELEAELSLSPKEAEAVVSYRSKNGNFKSLDDLKRVPDVDAKKLDAKKSRLIL